MYARCFFSVYCAVNKNQLDPVCEESSTKMLPTNQPTNLYGTQMIFKKSIWSQHGNFTCTSTSDQSGHGSNGNVGAFYTPQIFRNGTLLSDSVQCHNQKTLPHWHTYPDPHLGSWNCLPHQAHVALSEPMSSIDQQGSSLGSFPTSPSPLSPL